MYILDIDVAVPFGRDNPLVIVDENDARLHFEGLSGQLLFPAVLQIAACEQILLLELEALLGHQSLQLTGHLLDHVVVVAPEVFGEDAAHKCLIAAAEAEGARSDLARCRAVFDRGAVFPVVVELELFAG